MNDRTMKACSLWNRNSRVIRFVLFITLVLFVHVNTILSQDTDLFGSMEDDSLLFGDEFDLGGDDVSFDFDLEGESSMDFDASLDEESDDWFIDEESNDEISSESETESDDFSVSAEDEWGFIKETPDYEDLIKRRSAEEDEEDFILEEDPDHPLNLKKYVEGTIFENTGFTLSLLSPQFVSDTLTTWYSFLDFSLCAELPWHLQYYPVDLAFSIEISTFDFENTFPAGGHFRGISAIPMATANIFGLEAELGAGLYYPSFGVMTGLGYSYQFYSIFVSTGYRWNWVYDIQPVGSGWWFEPRFTVGVKFW